MDGAKNEMVRTALLLGIGGIVAFFPLSHTANLRAVRMRLANWVLRLVSMLLLHLILKVVTVMTVFATGNFYTTKPTIIIARFGSGHR